MIYVAVQPVPEPDHDAERSATIGRFFGAIQAGDYPALLDVLEPDAITRWPQSGERITGAMSCVRVYEGYPDGPPSFDILAITGHGDSWVAELASDYGNERWFMVSVIEFAGPKITRMTDYFAPTFAAPDWRRDLVELEPVVSG